MGSPPFLSVYAVSRLFDLLHKKLKRLERQRLNLRVAPPTTQFSDKRALENMKQTKPNETMSSRRPSPPPSPESSVKARMRRSISFDRESLEESLISSSDTSSGDISSIDSGDFYVVDDVSKESRLNKRQGKKLSKRDMAISMCLAGAVLLIIANSALLGRYRAAKWSLRGMMEPSFVPQSDPVFAGLPVSPRSFQQVRENYDMASETNTPMSVVRLPADFTGEGNPKNVASFVQLSRSLLHDTIALQYPKRKSDFAIVSICINMDLCTITPRNHQAYADINGYDYLLASTAVDGIHPKMLKYVLLTWALAQGYEWVLMMDADALFLRTDITIESLLRSHTTINDSTSLVLTRGGNWKNVHGINNGIFLLKNSEWSFQHLYEIFTAKWSYTRFLGKTLIDQPIQLSILVAEQELQWPPVKEEEVGPHVTIVPKRHLNAFYRDQEYSSRDAEEGGSWEPGDFIAHFASGQKYSLMINILEQEGLVSSIPKPEERFSFPLPAPGRDIDDAGTCWCDDSNEVHCIPSFHVIGVHKAGTKSLMNYLKGHPGIWSTGFIEDRDRWLTGRMTNTEASMCAKLSKKVHPAYIMYGRRRILSCSFDDYTLAYGQQLTEHGATCQTGGDIKFPPAVEPKPLFDEMVIWDNTFDRVRGVPLPHVFRKLQPSANLIISIRDPIDVTYSAYNHFGPKVLRGIGQSPDHFHSFIRNMTQVWTERQCTPANYRSCLSPEYGEAGSWLSRGMYSRYLSKWLEYFPSSQMHIFDVAADARSEVERIFDFMGVGDLEAAANVTASTYDLLAHSNSTVNSNDTDTKSNPMNMRRYNGMLDETRSLLQRFFAPYEVELCHLLREHAMKVPSLDGRCDFLLQPSTAVH